MGKKILDRALVFGTGASFYSLLETIWRGHTHWSMFLLAGMLSLPLDLAKEHMAWEPMAAMPAFRGDHHSL